MSCRSRSSRFCVAVIASVVLVPATAEAAELPPIRTSEANRVVDCATPGRLTRYVKERNPKVDARYDGLAAEYKRFGEQLRVRWDYAFFQMLLETGYLAYGGDVKADQNNFAGLGATGKGARGERFKDISSGARAHIEHLVMYSGEHVDNPVAERTRKIQEWGVLTDWQKSTTGPITFNQLAAQWAPGSRRYASDMATIAERFYDGICKGPDPDAAVVAAVEGPPQSPRTAEMTGGTSVDQAGLSSKGAAVAAAMSDTKAGRPAQTASAKPVTLLNPEAKATNASVDAVVSEAEAAAATKPGKAVEVAALPGAIAGAGADTAGDAKTEKQKPETPRSETPRSETPKSGDKGTQKSAAGAKGACRVWTASYGGAKAIIIKAVSDKTVNYTVLDVNEGSEKREADAYINAYAKGGTSVGEFPNQTQALEKAFELCPEG